jgi:PilZ domain/Gram-negative bacterial TonB protein C-terminal
MSTSTDPIAVLHPTLERRFYPRVTPSSPIYIAFGSNNLGTLLNVSENGLLAATPIALDVNSVYRVFLTLDGAPSAITVSVRTIWTDKSQNSSGIQLLDLSEQNREQIRKWVAAQAYRNEHLDNWVTPGAQERPPDNRSQQTTRRAQEITGPPPQAGDSKNKPAFPPMPLPIHGEFTYEPPPGVQKELFPVRRRKSTVRSRSRSSASRFALWTVIVAACLAAWTFRGKAGPFRDRVSDLFLHRSVQVASERASQVDQGPLSVVTDGTAAPAEELASPSATDLGPNVGAGSNGGTPSPTGAPRALPPLSRTGNQLEPTVRATQPNFGAVVKRATEPGASRAPRSYGTDFKATDSSPRPRPAENTASVVAPTAEDLPAPTIAAPASIPATLSPPAKAPAANDSVAKAPSSDTLPPKSAIVGSISNSTRPSNPFARRPPDTAPISAVPPAAAPRANSYVAPRSNPNGPAAIQMDVSEARVVEVNPPRGLTGGFTASLVNLPGERVIRSASITIHIRRSVRVPRERIPGERWLWRGREKVAVGELSSRVDPQVPQPSPSYGSITVEASIDKDGYVTEVKPLYGSSAFLPNVSRAIREWRYEPTYLNSKPVETQAKIELDFHPTVTRSNNP